MRKKMVVAEDIGLGRDAYAALQKVEERQWYTAEEILWRHGFLTLSFSIRKVKRRELYRWYLPMIQSGTEYRNGPRRRPERR